jgi:hypothetical protein
MCGSVRPSFLAWLLKSTHSLGQSDKLGHVVAEGNGRDLRKHVEKSVAVGVDEVVASRLGVVADQDVGARVLDLVDRGGLNVSSALQFYSASPHSALLTAALEAGPGTAAVDTCGLSGSSGMRLRDENARRGRWCAVRSARAGTAERIMLWEERDGGGYVGKREEKKTDSDGCYVLYVYLVAPRLHASVTSNRNRRQSSHSLVPRDDADRRMDRRPAIQLLKRRHASRVVRSTEDIYPLSLLTEMLCSADISRDDNTKSMKGHLDKSRHF